MVDVLIDVKITLTFLSESGLIFLHFQLGLVCFRLRGSDELNQKLLSTINASGRLHMVPASVNEKYVIRFCVCAQNATDEDIEYAWKTLSKMATDVIEKVQLLVRKLFSCFLFQLANHSTNTYTVCENLQKMSYSIVLMSARVINCTRY